MCESLVIHEKMIKKIYLLAKKGGLILPLWHFYFSVVLGSYFDIIFFKIYPTQYVGGEYKITIIKKFRIPCLLKLIFFWFFGMYRTLLQFSYLQKLRKISNSIIYVQKTSKTPLRIVTVRFIITSSFLASVVLFLRNLFLFFFYRYGITLYRTVAVPCTDNPIFYFFWKW